MAIAPGQTITAADILTLVAPTVSSGTPSSVTFNGTDKVFVFVTGTVQSATNTTQTVSLKYNGTAKATMSIHTGGSSTVMPFSLFYTETPASGTHNLTVDSSGDFVFADVLFMVIKIKQA